MSLLQLIQTFASYPPRKLMIFTGKDDRFDDKRNKFFPFLGFWIFQVSSTIEPHANFHRHSPVLPANRSSPSPR